VTSASRGSARGSPGRCSRPPRTETSGLRPSSSAAGDEIDASSLEIAEARVLAGSLRVQRPASDLPTAVRTAEGERGRHARPPVVVQTGVFEPSICSSVALVSTRSMSLKARIQTSAFGSERFADLECDVAGSGPRAGAVVELFRVRPAQHEAASRRLGRLWLVAIANLSRASDRERSVRPKAALPRERQRSSHPGQSPGSNWGLSPDRRDGRVKC